MIVRQEVKHLLFFFLLTLISLSSHAQNSKGHPQVFVEFLYWQAREGSDENWSQNITPKGAEQSVTLYDAPLQFNPGFRLGLGYGSMDNTWDVVAYYTYYTTSASNHAEGDIYSAYIGNFFANNTDGANFGPFYDSAKIDWDFSFQTIDLELGRHFEIDKILTLRPFIGLKTAIIDQKIDSDWYGPKTETLGVIVPITSFSTANETLIQDFWGIGPSFGLDTQWPLYQAMHQNLSLIGNFSGALLWGHWEFSDKYHNNTPVSITTNTDSFNGAETMVRGILGMEWSNRYSEIDVTIRLSYEAQVWFNQMQYYNFNMGRLNNLMSIQGGNLGFNLKF